MPKYVMGTCMWPIMNNGVRHFCGQPAPILDANGSQRAFCAVHNAEAEAKVAAIKAANAGGRGGPFKSQKMKIGTVVKY